MLFKETSRFSISQVGGRVAVQVFNCQMARGSSSVSFFHSVGQPASLLEPTGRKIASLISSTNRPLCWLRIRSLYQAKCMKLGSVIIYRQGRGVGRRILAVSQLHLPGPPLNLYSILMTLPHPPLIRSQFSMVL